ncbi:hypothetical protein PR048_009201 [Dryococelus australis]|uniref:Ig-like domain-containing protein n=1 Tax=Dryococelus australis TaxID=614101 RepID=A0ABQ9HZ85_9NEOP|nr:hypothetical protein PR048_009201 [Dryococelus australis]
MGDPREKLPTSDIVWHDSNMRDQNPVHLGERFQAQQERRKKSPRDKCIARNTYSSVRDVINLDHNAGSTLSVHAQYEVARRAMTFHVELKMPRYVLAGDSATLRCEHSVGPQQLRKVEWLKGNTKIFQYVKGRTPPFRSYRTPGAELDRATRRRKPLQECRGSIGIGCSTGPYVYRQLAGMREVVEACVSLSRHPSLFTAACLLATSVFGRAPDTCYTSSDVYTDLWTGRA